MAVFKILLLIVGLLGAVIGGTFLRDMVKSDSRSEKDNQLFEYATYAGLGVVYVGYAAAVISWL